MTDRTPPTNLRYSLNDAEKYRRLTTDELSPFKGANYADVLVYAAAYGFKNGRRETLTNPQSNIPFSALSREDAWILKAIAVADTGSLTILGEEKDAYKVAEEYANFAIEEVYLFIFGGAPLEPYKRIVEDILQNVEK